MLRTLWKTVGQLKTPERKLLFELMLAIIIVLYLSFRDNDSDKNLRIKQLEKTVVQKDKAMETQRILLMDKLDQAQEKLDQCQDEKYNALKDFWQQTEEIKKIYKK